MKRKFFHDSKMDVSERFNEMLSLEITSMGETIVKEWRKDDKHSEILEGLLCAWIYIRTMWHLIQRLAEI